MKATIGDNNTYKTVKIGEQEWMAENLDVSVFRNGDPIPEVKTHEEWGIAGKERKPAWCYYKNDSTHGQKHGKLYNWYAVTDPRGLAPEGWHVPTDAEWQTLVDYLGGASVAGGKMKETGTTHWLSPNVATNESGFSALPGGYRGYPDSFAQIGSHCYFWSSSEKSDFGAWCRYPSYENSEVGHDSTGMRFGFSVRCVRD